MKKIFVFLLFLAIASTAFSQDSTATILDWKTQLAEKVKNLQAQLTVLENDLADSTHAGERFSEELLNEIYASQRQLEDLSYQFYGRTDFPTETPLEDLPFDSTFISEEPSEDMPPTPPFPGGFPGMKNNKSPRTIFRFGFGFGFSDVADLTDRTTGVLFPRFDTYKSGYTSWQLLLENRLGKRDTTATFFGGFNPKKPWKRNDQFKNNRASIVYGITIDRNKLIESGNKVLTTKATGEGNFEEFASPVKRNEIVINSINLPVMLQFKAGKNIMFRLGGFAGVRTAARQTITYSENDFDFERIRKDNFDLAKFNYGLVAGFGWDGLYLSGKFNLNPFFKKSDTYDFRLFTYGLTFSM